MRKKDRISWRPWVLVIHVLFSVTACWSQAITFENINVRNELFANAVISIAQDAQGFIWLGSPEGLNRYDGHRFKLYKSVENDSSSLAGNYILSLFCDTQGKLWIGSDMGLQYYDVQHDAFVSIKNKSLTSTHIKAIAEDKHGNLWIGTDHGLVQMSYSENKHKVRTFRFNSLTHTLRDEVNCLYIDKKNTIWVGLNRGIARADLNKDSCIFTLLKRFPGPSHSIERDYVTSITGDLKNGLWFGTIDRGLFYYNDSTGDFSHYYQTATKDFLLASNSVRSLLSDRKGNIWVSTQNGISVINITKKTNIIYRHDPKDQKSLSQNSVYALYLDKQQSIWAGTYFGGVNIIHSVNTPFHTIKNEPLRSRLSSNIISSIIEDAHHNLWIGTQGGDGGLDYYNRANEHIVNYRNNPKDSASLSSNLIEVLYAGKDGYLLIGTHGGGLNILPPGSSRFKRYLFDKQNPADYNEGIITILEDAQGRTWLGHNTGIQLYHRQGQHLSRITGAFADKVAKQIATSLIEDRYNNIWIGTAKGLFLCKGSTLSATPVTQGINCLLGGANGVLYFGTVSQGLGLYNTATHKVSFITKENGMPGNNIIGILQDRLHNLWLSTDYGLVKFNPLTRSIKTYTTTDGLSDNRFNRNSFLRDSKGIFYFGGLNGITYFYPDSIAINSRPSPIVFTGLHIYGQAGQPLEASAGLYKQLINKHSINLHYNQNNFTIDFALLNYIKHEKNKYTYQLKGYDPHTITSGSGSASYTNITPGDYEFLLSAANNDGIRTPAIYINIYIQPPFWQTWWAYLIYTLILLAILFFIIQYFFLKAVLRKEDELHQNKLNFFTNISHEIRTHLSLIRLPLDKIIDNKQTDEVTAFQLAGIKTKFYRLLRLVTELMDFQKADTKHLPLHRKSYEFIAFLQEIFDNFQDLAIDKNIKATFRHNTDTIYFYFDKIQLEKSFFNILSNAFKFTPRQGRIEVLVNRDKTGFTVVIADNGRGIPAPYRDKIFTNYFQVAEDGMNDTGYGIGLALAKSIIELHEGRIRVESETAAGDNSGFTRFVIRFTLPGSRRTNEARALAVGDAPEPTIQSQPPNAVGSKTGYIAFPNEPVDTELQENSILIVEDNRELRSMIKEGLAPHFKVLEADNGMSGWELTAQQVPDLVITDVMMPVMDGIMLTRKIKDDQRTSHIPVIMLTAKSAQMDHEKGLEGGADVYISKPFSAKALLLNIKNLLILRNSARALLRRQLMSENQDRSSNYKITGGLASEQEFLSRFVAFIENNMDSPELNTEVLAREMAMSRPVLYKKIKALTDMSIHDFVKMMKLKRAAALLKEQTLSVKEICFTIGYSDRRYFSKEFKKYYGLSPSEYASRHNTSGS